jgi:hypothetical protein
MSLKLSKCSAQMILEGVDFKIDFCRHPFGWHPNNVGPLTMFTFLVSMFGIDAPVLKSPMYDLSFTLLRIVLIVNISREHTSYPARRTSITHTITCICFIVVAIVSFQMCRFQTAERCQLEDVVYLTDCSLFCDREISGQYVYILFRTYVPPNVIILFFYFRQLCHLLHSPCLVCVSAGLWLNRRKEKRWHRTFVIVDLKRVS